MHDPMATIDEQTTGSAAPQKAGASAVATASEKLREASTKLRETTESARHSVSEAYANARHRAGEAYDVARTRTAETGKRAEAAIDSNPVTALVGGLALGALIAAVLPKTRREGDYLGSIGGRLSETAREAAGRAREAGREKLSELGVTSDAAREKVGQLFDTAAQATSAATGAVREKILKRD